MKLKQLTPASVLPVTPAEVRRHLRLDESRGEQAPLAPIATVTASTETAIDAGIHRYRTTYVTATGETDGGLMSAPITIGSTQTKANVTNIPTGGDLVTARKLYRTEAGGTDYLLLATISDNTTSTYTDQIPDASLGTACPITNTTDDPELLDFIQAAVEECEDQTNRAFITQQFELKLNRFPQNTINDIIKNPYPMIFLPRGTIQRIDFIKYYDRDGIEQTWSTGSYYLCDSTEPAYIVPAYDSSNVKQQWPATQDREDAITVRYTAGYGDSASDVPARAKTAIRMFVNHMYENRGLIGPQQMEIPSGALSFLYCLKVHWRGGENQGL